MNGKIEFREWCNEYASRDAVRKELRGRIQDLALKLDSEDEKLTELTERAEDARSSARREELTRAAAASKAKCEAIETEIKALQGQAEKLAGDAGTNIDRDTLRAALDQTEAQSRMCMELEHNASQVQREMDALEGADGHASKDQLEEYGRLQAAASLLPRRVERMKSQLATMEHGLKAWAEGFIGSEIGPRSRRAANHARAKVRDLLKSDFQGEALARAVESSDLVQESNRLQVSIESNPSDGACGYVWRLLATFDALLAFEEKLGRRTNRAAAKVTA